MTVLRIGKPRRHPAAGNDLGDRLGPTGRRVVGRERKRSDLALAVAADAILIENRRDVFGIRDLAAQNRAVHAPNKTTDWHGRRLAHFLAGQQFVHSIDQVIAGCHRAGNAHTVLVVDHPAITHGTTRIKHECVGCALGTKLIGNNVAGILQDRKRNLMLVGIVSDVGQRVLSVGVDADEGHSLVFVAGRQLGQARTDQFCDRTFRSQEDGHNNFLPGPLVQPMCRAEIIVQLEVADFLADGRVVCRRRGNQKAVCDQRSHDERSNDEQTESDAAHDTLLHQERIDQSRILHSARTVCKLR